MPKVARCRDSQFSSQSLQHDGGQVGPFTLNLAADKMPTLKARGSGVVWLRKWLSLSCTSLPGRSLRSHARGHSPPAHLRAHAQDLQGPAGEGTTLPYLLNSGFRPTRPSPERSQIGRGHALEGDASSPHPHLWPQMPTRYKCDHLSLHERHTQLEGPCRPSVQM